MQAAHDDEILWEFGRRQDGTQVSVQPISENPDSSVNITSAAERECMVNSDQLWNDDRISNTSTHPTSRERRQINEIVSSALLPLHECPPMMSQSQRETLGSVYYLHQHNLAHEVDHSADSRCGNSSYGKAPIIVIEYLLIRGEEPSHHPLQLALSKYQ